MITTIESPLLEPLARTFVRRLKKCRGACKNWARQLTPLSQREQDTKILVDVLDLLEEVRPLSHAELTLHRLAIYGLGVINQEKLTFWRQRFKLRLATEWDENSRFFHTAANRRRRKNWIKTLELDGATFESHQAKSAILRDFYKNLFGRPVDTSWNFDLHNLYPHLSVDGSALSAPFDDDEISTAVFSMDMNASPGPDGFGPSFYKAF